LDRADQALTLGLLDIVLGLAIDSNRRRAMKFHRSLGQKALPEEGWVAMLRCALVAEVVFP
jgi:hypothetical protein